MKTKREKFEEAGRFPVKKVLVISLVVAVVVAGAVVGYRLSTRTPAVGGEVVQEGGADYSGGPIAMVLLENLTVDAETVELSLAEVTSKQIGGVLYSRTTPMPAGYDDLGNNSLPILAYVAPSGKLVVATSLCEPCHSYNFHIEGNDLVCNSCYTHWDLNTLDGISGGCRAYPPSELKAGVQGDKIIVDKAVLESWVPRI